MTFAKIFHFSFIYLHDLYLFFQVMDKRLLTRTYLVGERVSLADLVTCLYLLPAFKHVLGKIRNDMS